MRYREGEMRMVSNPLISCSAVVEKEKASTITQHLTFLNRREGKE
ncbi:hypothetical protein IC006_0599 [Sulfuracidifex tepidarius]|uniref:Uncharacterized protein n=1 Tax=Sulfuracidifex tepidarius TaxID=1294262 RepID=A0A510DT47_9CREN|nr:hypothetical protein IC006_0599 [Sulfuracidifex tepidarius]BBG26066.1 hypothetical protein IC007_0571 [Sulfuracidifex tepidarius]